MADSWLHEAVCRQRHELWLTVGYMKLCVDRDLNCDRMFLHGVLSRWSDVGYGVSSQVVLEFRPNFGPSIVTVFHSTQSSLGRTVGRKNLFFPYTLHFFRFLDSAAIGYIGSTSVYIF